MQLDETGPLYSRIGQILRDGLDHPNHPTLMFIRRDEGAIYQVIVEDCGNYIFWHRLPGGASTEMDDAIEALWAADPSPEHWVEMIYTLDQDKFHAELYYPDQLDPQENEFDRSERIIRERFGDKPARSNPFPGEPPADYHGKL